VRGSTSKLLVICHQVSQVRALIKTWFCIHLKVIQTAAHVLAANRLGIILLSTKNGPSSV